MTTTTSNFYTTYRFFVEIQSITAAMFNQCSGLQTEVEVEEWREGGLNDVVHRLPVRVKPFSNLVLKRGIATLDLWNWHYNVIQGTIKRHNLSIYLIGYDDMTKVQWDVIGALPIKWSGPDLKADAGETAFETIELIHQGLKRVQ